MVDVILGGCLGLDGKWSTIHANTNATIPASENKINKNFGLELFLKMNYWTNFWSKYFIETQVFNKFSLWLIIGKSKIPFKKTKSSPKIYSSRYTRKIMCQLLKQNDLWPNLRNILCTTSAIFYSSRTRGCLWEEKSHFLTFIFADNMSVIHGLMEPYVWFICLHKTINKTVKRLTFHL